MKRTIKFRGMRIDDKKWVYGDLIHDKSITQTGLRDRVRVGKYEVIPETVGQFTGLCDKNGKEIYENDIVNCYFYDHFEIKEITFNKKEAMFNTPSIFYDDDGNYAPYEAYFVEVVGNIHDDNPELLTNK